MIRPSVQVRLCFGFSALAVVFAAGAVVGADVVLVAVAGFGASGVVAAGGADSETAGGRSRYFGLSAAGAAASLICVGAAVALVVCGAAVSLLDASDRLRGPPAWADAEARTMAATNMILRM